jgi:hypothetical protein
MTNIEQKALALVNEIERERGEDELTPRIMRDLIIDEALCRAIEQREAAEHELADFKQKVSDVVEQALSFGDVESLRRKGVLSRFIIPKPKPDPLVEIIGEINDGPYVETRAEYADRLRAALDALGFEIREKSQ